MQYITTKTHKSVKPAPNNKWTKINKKNPTKIHKRIKTKDDKKAIKSMDTETKTCNKEQTQRLFFKINSWKKKQTFSPNPTHTCAKSIFSTFYIRRSWYKIYTGRKCLYSCSLYNLLTSSTWMNHATCRSRLMTLQWLGVLGTGLEWEVMKSYV